MGRMLTIHDDLEAYLAVPPEGLPPQPEAVAPMRAAVLELVGDQDERLMGLLPGARAAFATIGVDYADHAYEGVGHTFFTETNPNTVHALVADDAWLRTLRFLEAH